MTMTLTEIAEVEATQEYQFDQRLVEFDEKLAKLRARLNAIHQHDRAFARLMRKANRRVVLCDQCRKEA